MDGKVSKIKGLLTELNITMERIQGGPVRDISSGAAVRHMEASKYLMDDIERDKIEDSSSGHSSIGETY